MKHKVNQMNMTLMMMKRNKEKITMKKMKRINIMKILIIMMKMVVKWRKIKRNMMKILSQLKIKNG